MYNALLCFCLSLLLCGCGEKSTSTSAPIDSLAQQNIINKKQLNALENAKNVSDVMDKANEQQQKALEKQLQ